MGCLILEAFSTYLKQKQDLGLSPERILFDWLHRILLLPPAPEHWIENVVLVVRLLMV